MVTDADMKNLAKIEKISGFTCQSLQFYLKNLGFVICAFVYQTKKI